MVSQEIMQRRATRLVRPLFLLFRQAFFKRLASD